MISPSSNSSSPLGSSLSKSEIIAKQYEIFAIQPNDPEIKKMNKKTIQKLMRNLEKKNILVGKTLDDFEIVDDVIGGESKVYKAYEAGGNNQYPQFKAIKRKEIPMNSKLTFFREIEILTTINHENVIKMEEVFFEYDKRNRVYSINIVMPWIEQNFLSWLLKKSLPPQQQHFTSNDIIKNKRTFEEVRNLLISALKSINVIHAYGIIHLDIKFDNILVRERFEDEEDLFEENGNNLEENEENQIREEEDLDVEEEKKRVFECVIADLGIGQNLYKLTTQFAGTPEFIAPELISFSDKKRLQAESFDEEELKKKGKKALGMNLIEKSDFFTTKADIYSFGVILYKLFINESEKIDISKISQQNIENRLKILFKDEQRIIPVEYVQDLEVILQNCFQNNPRKRMQASNLLYEHIFFSKSKNLNEFYEKLESEQENETSFSVSHLGEKNLDAEFEHALKYFEGKDNSVPKDMKIARKIFQELSDMGHMPSRYFLGWMLRMGFGGFIDDKKGNELCLSASKEAKKFFDEKIAKSQTNLKDFYYYISACMYFCGHNLPKNFAKAFEYFTISAGMGNSFAQIRLGFMHQNGVYVQKSLEKSFEFYQLSAIQENCNGLTINFSNKKHQILKFFDNI